jgi:hypothetical protein
MKFSFKVWKLTFTLDIFDVDFSDGDIGIGLIISWK